MGIDGIDMAPSSSANISRASDNTNMDKSRTSGSTMLDMGIFMVLIWHHLPVREVYADMSHASGNTNMETF